MSSKKRSFTAEEKLAILEEGRAPGASIAEVCRRHQISYSMYYKWEQNAKDGMREGLKHKPSGPRDSRDDEINRLKTELLRKNYVIAQLTEALVQEKKGLSDYLRKGI